MAWIAEKLPEVIGSTIPAATQRKVWELVVTIASKLFSGSWTEKQCIEMQDEPLIKGLLWYNYLGLLYVAWGLFINSSDTFNQQYIFSANRLILSSLLIRIFVLIISETTLRKTMRQRISEKIIERKGRRLTTEAGHQASKKDVSLSPKFCRLSSSYNSSKSSLFFEIAAASASSLLLSLFFFANSASVLFWHKK